MKYADGTQYEGQWKNNMKHGQGTFITKEGVKYQGQFSKDEKVGKGAIKGSNQNKLSISKLDHPAYDSYKD